MASLMLDINLDNILPSFDGLDFDSDMLNVDDYCDSTDDGFWDGLTELSTSSSISDTLLTPELDSTIEDLWISGICQNRAEPADQKLEGACQCTGLSTLSSHCAELSPILRDCMWSATSGLIPVIIPLNSQSASGSRSDSTCSEVPHHQNHKPDSCSICTSCVNQTTVCVDPKAVFPYPVEFLPKAAVQRCVEECDVASEATTLSPMLYEESETSAYSSAVSDDELEEIDVVSVVSSCGTSDSSNYYSSSDQSQMRRQMLVLPASESISAQVAAMHNYSTTRCRPTTVTSSPAPTTSCNISTKRYAKRLVGKAASRKRRRHTASKSWNSESTEDNWMAGNIDDDRCKRAQHNVMERRRRHHLKGNFFRLRDVIPDLSGDGRVSKVAILCQARVFIERLSAKEAELQMEFDKLRSVQTRLKWKLSLLQRDQRLAMASNN